MLILDGFAYNRQTGGGVRAPGDRSQVPAPCCRAVNPPHVIHPPCTSGLAETGPPHGGGGCKCGSRRMWYLLKPVLVTDIR